MNNNTEATSNKNLNTEENQTQINWDFAMRAGLVLCVIISMFSSFFDNVKLSNESYVVYFGICASYYLKVYQGIKNKKNFRNFWVSFAASIIALIFYILPILI